MPNLLPILCRPHPSHPHSSSPPPPLLSKKSIHELYIILGTVFYGISIVFAKEAMNINMQPNSFNALQYVVGAVFLLFTRKRLKGIVNGGGSSKEEKEEKEGREDVRHNATPLSPWLISLQQRFPDSIRLHPQFELIMLGAFMIYVFGVRHEMRQRVFECFKMTSRGGVMGAIPGFSASALNQLGLCSIDAGKSAFLSSLYVVITPLIQYVLQGSRANLTIHTWYSAVVCLVGTYLLSGASFDTIGTGEILTVFGAFLISLEILLNDYSIERVDCIDLTCAQMCTSMTLCVLVSLFLEPRGMYNVLTFSQNLDSESSSSTTHIMYWSFVLVVGGGIFEAMAFQLHVVGQMHASGSRAALLFGLEAVVTGVCAYFFLGEVLSNIELVGCTLILVSTLIVTSMNENDEDSSERESKPLMV